MISNSARATMYNSALTRTLTAQDAASEDDDSDAGDAEQAGKTAGDAGETTASGAKKEGEMHKYAVPRLNSLPHDVSRRDRVIGHRTHMLQIAHRPSV